MRKTKFLALSIAVGLLLSVFTVALAYGDAPITDFDKQIDLLRDVQWADKEQLDGDLKNDGMYMTQTQSFTHITVPLSLTVDVSKIEYLFLTIKGFPADIGWNWGLDYKDDRGNTGTIRAGGELGDYNIEGFTGDFNGEFQISGHFNWRNNNADANLNLEKITFTELRFFSAADAGTKWVFENFFFATLAGSDPGSVAKPTGNQPPVTTTKANNGNTKPVGGGDPGVFMVVMTGLAGLAGAGALVIKKRK